MSASRQIPIAAPCIGEEEWQALRAPILSGWIAQGDQVAAFEQAFARRHNVKHAVATTSGTTALHLALLGLGIGPGDEVIVPAFTWIATANAVLYCGATPIFVDIDAQTFNLNPSSVTEKVTPATKAIIVVHLFGLCADIDAITTAAPGIPIIEDAACAAGASYKGRASGSLGIAGVFSFHPRKTITTGEGGMLTTNSNELAKQAIQLRNHGAKISSDAALTSRLPDFETLGFNYRMTDLQGAMGAIQLSKLDHFIEERREHAQFYNSELNSIPWLITPQSPTYCEHTWQAYVCLIDERRSSVTRNELMATLSKRGISTRPGTHAVHMLALYRDKFKSEPDLCPNARDCDRYSIAIPLHNVLTDKDRQYVVESIQNSAKEPTTSPRVSDILLGPHISLNSCDTQFP